MDVRYATVSKTSGKNRGVGVSDWMSRMKSFEDVVPTYSEKYDHMLKTIDQKVSKYRGKSKDRVTS